MKKGLLAISILFFSVTALAKSMGEIPRPKIDPYSVLEVTWNNLKNRKDLIDSNLFPPSEYILSRLILKRSCSGYDISWSWEVKYFNRLANDHSITYCVDVDSGEFEVLRITE